MKPKKLVIVCEITDPETVETYWDVAKELVEDDIRYGDLNTIINVESVDVVDA